ncbi:MAG: hypothetical protein IJE46_06165 [Clostridia bacterium]|nr:hypothetical protein [Clostridia bacterium]
MDIKVELLKNYVSDYINQHITDFVIDANKVADSTAIKILKQISDILKNDAYDDIDMVEEIVRIFEKYGIDTGSCHDY